MPVINKESLVAEDLEKKTGINRLEIRNFREKLGEVLHQVHQEVLHQVVRVQYWHLYFW